LTSESYSSVARVDVCIVSASEPTPQFAQSSYSAVIAENSPRGATVANITVRNRPPTTTLCSVYYWHAVLCVLS